MKNKVVVGRDLTPDWIEKVGKMLAEIFRQMCLWFKEPGKGLSIEQLQAFIEHRNPFLTPSYSDLINEWRKFYKKVFNITVDLSDIRIPEKQDGFNWLIIMLRGLTAQKLFDKCQELFGAWKWIDKSLDDVLNQAKSIRNPKDGTYTIWIRDRVEADEELKNRSANNLEQDHISGITLEERLLLELFYFWKANKHLDINNITLCSGSRYDDGDVPSVIWRRSNGRLGVDWYDPSIADGGLRARQVVS